MSNHPNRGKGPRPGQNPSPEDIKRLREKFGLTQVECAALVYRSERNWIQWESGERRMDPAIWELWILKATKPKPEK